MKVAKSAATRHGLALPDAAPKASTSKSELQSKESAKADEELEIQHHGGFWDGRYVLSLRGSEHYISRASKWTQLPPEMFVLLGETGYSKVRIQKETAQKLGQQPVM